MSNWECVTQLLESERRPIVLGKYHSSITHTTPRRMLNALSYYKFAAKMIGSGKRVLDVGCNAGFGSWVIAKECGYCKGVDCDREAIEVASRNFQHPSITFEALDFFKMTPEIYDAVISFDVIAQMDLEHASVFAKRLADHLSNTGVAVIGTPSSMPELSLFFEHVFLFSANDEIIHTGSLPMASYLIALCCKPKRSQI